jgi:hypothetical protein
LRILRFRKRIKDDAAEELAAHAQEWFPNLTKLSLSEMSSFNILKMASLLTKLTHLRVPIHTWPSTSVDPTKQISKSSKSDTLLSVQATNLMMRCAH